MLCFRHTIISSAQTQSAEDEKENEFNYNQANFMFSAYFNQFSANNTTQINWIGERTPYITDELAFSYRTKNGLIIRPSARYNVSNGQFMSYKAEIEKRMQRGNFSVSYESNVMYNDHFLNVTYRHDLPFARTSVSASHSKGGVTTGQSANGSLAFGGGNKYVHISNNSSVGKGGIILHPFLDLNQNGIFDDGEKLVNLTSAKINGGRAVFNKKDSLVRFPDLNAFTNYTISLNDNDLENIAWRFTDKTYQVMVDPNQFKRVDIPIISVGEVSGMAYIDKQNALKGIGRIWIKIYKKNSNEVVAETLSESDGYIYFLGLAPGEYKACIDSVQLRNLDFSADPPCKYFTIRALEDGDIVDGIEFVLRANTSISYGQQKADSAIATATVVNSRMETQQPKIYADTLVNNTTAYHRVLQGKQAQQSKDGSVKPDFNDSSVDLPCDTLYKVQLLALRKPIQAKDYFAQLLEEVPGIVIVEKLEADGLYHYSAGAFCDESAAREYMHTIKGTGWKDSFIAVYAGGMLLEKQVRIEIPANRIAPADALSSYKNTPPEKGMHITERVVLVNDAIENLNYADTVYRVQLLALHKPVTTENSFGLLISRLPGVKIVELFGEDNLYHYSAGVFKSLAEARKYEAVIRRSGWVDSFITTYISGKRE